MSMFPSAHAEIYRNEEGEVLGWSSTYYDEPEYDPYEDDYYDYDDEDDE